MGGISNDLKNGVRGADFENNLLVVSNEIKKELKSLPDISFSFADDLTPEKINPEIATATLNFLESRRKYYINVYNFYDTKRNDLIENLQRKDKEAFLELRDKHHNGKLEEFVLNKNETKSLIEYKGELVQKMDPIFMDPEYKFIRAHFYSPTKRIFGVMADTYVVNVIVLWIMTAILYLVLYFRLLKKLLDSGDVAMGKTVKGSE
jgi:hypothetical protein